MTDRPRSHGTHIAHISHILIGISLLLAACATKPAVTTTPPTPFPTLPLTPTPTATSYVFVPSGATAVTALSTPLPSEGDVGTIPVDGELVSLIPPLDVAFPPGVSGRLESLHVALGQWVAEGDLIASVDAPDLRRALYDAERAAEQAKAARAAAEERAAKAYQRAQRSAQWNLDRARHAVQVAEKRPPTTAVARAEVALARAREAEAVAADAYQQSLDRSWESSEVRDGLYKAWQATIAARKLAELDLQDAQRAVEVHTMTLAALRREVNWARTTLEALEQEVDPSLAWAESEALRALTAAQERMALNELYAPRAGWVVAVGAAVGATVNDRTPIVTLLDTEELRFVTSNLEERQAAALRPGQAARIVLRFYPETLILGEVEMLVLRVQVQGGGRFAAYLRLTDAAGLELLPGMTGRAEIPVGEE